MIPQPLHQGLAGAVAQPVIQNRGIDRLALEKDQRRGVCRDDSFGLRPSLAQLVGLVDAGRGFVVDDENPLADQGGVFSAAPRNGRMI